MKLRNTTITLITAMGLTLSSASAFAEHHSIADKVKQAMQSDIRTDAEKERDDNRLPAQTLEFFGLQEDMRILELIPGGGWYTKILAPLVAEKGQYYAAMGTSGIKERLTNTAGFEKIQIVAEDAKLWREEGDRFYSLDLNGFGVNNIDIVFTFRNYHNFNAQGRAAMNKAAFEALKPGGIYAVVDHTARHMEPMNGANRRRVDPVLAIKEIQAAGFEFVDYSDIHYRQDDELEYEVGAKSVTGNTDRWTMKFRKPN
ncbi:methyltransferase [Aliiglaciecola sp. LCG003]|uniref:class I SAM-dependent methyltransferase n=1 Tax=Aliiglaciecola sp. LCG003 TaxID=3053655 RepID=UPI002573290A|nr:methyltransferase [Aliiglaciecola sp. LCG003]WJG09381.1 methyltransferase [Aliiglaciecola sp. LCG003]